MSRIVMAAALLLASASALAAQKAGTPTPAPQKAATQKTTNVATDSALRAGAKVSEDSARKIALKAVPGGTVKAVEIEAEKGKVIWSVDLKIAGKAGTEEVNIDAKTGKVVAKEHETDKMEKAEAKAEAREGKAMPSPKKPATIKP